MAPETDFRPIILAGGSGTRFWPRSRRARAKQVLALDGERTMIQRTVDRLAPLAGPERVWVITNDLLSGTICGQLDCVPEKQIVCEPAARNTAPAAGLAAFLLERIAPNSVLGIFPSDHVIANESAFLSTIRQAVELAAAGENMVVLGIAPTRAETGYGYIETGDAFGENALRVRRFTEKPNQERAEEFIAAGNYFWNSGMFIWSARTLANAVREHLPETAPLLEKIAASWETPDFRRVFTELYPKCENISVDYAVLEPRSSKGEHHSNLFCLPANFGWNDLGSWAALYEHHLDQGNADSSKNVTESNGGLAYHAGGNYVFSPKKFVALVGVEDIVVVETEDALLITTRHHSQDVGKVVKELAAKHREDLI
ncbi:mannose-1-phosphate guanylyltransferase [Paracidobacterium acidisoli]|uniref:mannose-1-phosphate guanylyltransferase n=1 Tax=Paracidobacterium acidisoli TaxID=2303751 RepID=A0A372IJD1_9BACT|nr:mannose-1-phosphate guanylyltransferase [Paracidobacterium acidisoli]MBT9333291.1 NTP transferase domain-containing protein [Paracidobacterium acidisoli]